MYLLRLSIDMNRLNYDKKNDYLLLIYSEYLKNIFDRIFYRDRIEEHGL